MSEGEGVPIFIVGCGRSGTTMLRLMIDSHSEVAIPGESHFIPELWRRRRRYLGFQGAAAAELLASDIMRTVHFQRWELPAECVRVRLAALERPSFAEVVGAFYRAYADHRGKPRWGDKTPIYVRRIPLLASLFPEARFIHIIRDGRDVALSYLSVPWGPRTIWEAALKWRADVLAGRASAGALGANRYLELRYEELVNEPREQLDRMCRFADLEFEESMLEYHSSAALRLQAGPRGTRFHGSATRPPTLGLRDWRAQMSKEQLMAFEAVAGDLLEELGYPVSHDYVPGSWRARAALWVWGLNLWGAGSLVKRRSRELFNLRPPFAGGAR